MARKRIGELLVEAGVLSEQQLAAALAEQQRSGGRIGRILVEHRLVPEDRLVRMLSAQLGIAVGDLPIEAPPPALLQLIPREIAQRCAVFPVGVRKDARGDLLFLAMADPTNTEVIQQISLATGKQVLPFLAGELAIERAVDCWYAAVPTAPPATATESGELPIVTGVVTTPPRGTRAPEEITATFDRPGTYLGDDSAEADGTMPPPIDFDQLTLAGPALLQPVSAPPSVAEPAPVAPPALAPTPEPELLVEVEAEPLDLVEAAEPEPPRVASSPAAPSAPPPACPSCGAERIAGARFCPHCGCSFTGAPRASLVPTPRVTDLLPRAPSEPSKPASERASAGAATMSTAIDWAASSDAARCDEVEELLGRGAPALAVLVSIARGVVDLPSDAALADEPTVLAGGGAPRARALAGGRSALALADEPATLMRVAPRRRSLAADWADVAERPMARKEHGTAELAVQRGRDLLLVTTPDEETPAAPAPEPQIAYEPAPPASAADPAPWAAFASTPAIPDEKK